MPCYCVSVLPCPRTGMYRYGMYASMYASLAPASCNTHYLDLLLASMVSIM